MFRSGGIVQSAQHFLPSPKAHSAHWAGPRFRSPQSRPGSEFCDWTPMLGSCFWSSRSKNHPLWVVADEFSILIAISAISHAAISHAWHAHVASAHLSCSQSHFAAATSRGATEGGTPPLSTPPSSFLRSAQRRQRPPTSQGTPASQPLQAGTTASCKLSDSWAKCDWLVDRSKNSLIDAIDA